MRSFNTFCFSTIIAASFVNAQHPLPLNDNDWVEANEKIFLKDEVTEVYITMAEEDLDFIIDNTDLDELKNCTVRFVNSEIDETYTSVGIRATGDSQRDATKFPWKLDFNEWVDRKVFGLEKMNFNSESVEPTITRATLAMDLFRAMGVAVSRSSHVWLTINDGTKVQGIYNNVEQIDEEFFKPWFDNNDGDTYKCRNKDQGATLRKLEPNIVETYEAAEDYEEQRTGSYQRLYDFINFIEDSDDETFKADIKDWLNVDSFLRAQAVDVAMGGWDGLYLSANNYYLYYDEDTGVFEYIPWAPAYSFGMDNLTSTFPSGTDFATKPIENWGVGCLIACEGESNGPPLVDRLLDIEMYYNMLEKYVVEVTSKHLHPFVLGSRANGVKDLLEDLVYSGTFSGPTMDNGFTQVDFLQGYENPSSYEQFAVTTWGILPFLREREGYIRNQYQLDDLFPRVVINEVLADNENGIIDENEQNEDWVELYNDSDEEVDLSGYFLTDRYGDARQWEIPEGTVIGPRDYLLIWCDNDEDEGPLHTNFKLSGSGEGVYLFANDPDLNLLVSSIVFPALDEDQSFGRVPDGGDSLVIFDNPTPLAVNVPDDMTLVVDGLPPALDVFPEGLLTVDCVGAVANVSITLLYSFFLPAEFPIPEGYPCGGTDLDLIPNPDQRVDAIADSTGRATFSAASFNTPGPIYLQALDLTTCETSNVIVISSDAV